jgi:bifunctional pyridoxal-dependent enzyme with beta-cystathionase and maltose regulon repressor activities
MKHNTLSTEEIRQRMGAAASTEEAERMIELLSAHGIADLADVSDEVWFDLVSDAINP